MNYTHTHTDNCVHHMRKLLEIEDYFRTKQVISRKKKSTGSIIAFYLL